MLTLTVVFSQLCILVLPVFAQEKSTPTTVPTIEPQQTITATQPTGADQAQLENDSLLDAQVETLLSKMNPADRVGQLFIVSFQGNDADFDPNNVSNGLSDAILQLIYGYRIGGVVISPRNGNLSNAKGTDTPRQVATLINQLQAASYGIVLPHGAELQPIPNEPWPPPNVTSLERLIERPPQNLPLLVAVEQMGDGLNATALRQGGFTELPSPLAIGSTWNPDLAQQIGTITGRELRAVGVNLLLGPNLDVVDMPRADAIGALGLYSFGGDPYWVSQMARAYISGVHIGGEGQVATIAQHFPGQGDVDRMPDEDMATIQKSQEELEQFAMAPFVNVTLRPSSILSPDGNTSSTDGLMSSHMRFTGLQGSGSGRATPLSLSPELSAVLDWPRFEEWRKSGGIMMSGSLGAPAIRRFYDPELKSFQAKLIAQAAFSAGNDLLFLDRFALTDDWADQLSNIQITIGVFHEQYTKDSAFAAQVDDAVRRILRLKLRLYAAEMNSPTLSSPDYSPMIPLSAILVGEDELALFGSEKQEQARLSVSTVARESISLLDPDPQVQTDPLLSAPQAEDKVVIFTDSRLLRECADCTTEAAIGPDEIAKTIDLFYGEDSTGQLPASQVTSLTFSELNELLDAAQSAPLTPTATVSATQIAPVALATAVESGVPASDASDTSSLDKNIKNEAKIAEADWLIFAMLDINMENHPNSGALKRFLRQRSEQLADKKLVVLAMGSPYFLDATEISKLTAYYGVYGRGREFVENTVRALFRSYAPTGSPAVDVPGTRFEKLQERLQPDSERRIPIRLTRHGEILVQNNTDRLQSEVASALLEAQTNDGVSIEVGPIIDFNGHPVVDGTTVEVTIVNQNGTTKSDTFQLLTTNGIASRELTFEQPTNIDLTATAGKANSGEPINLAVRFASPALVIEATTTNTVANQPSVSGTQSTTQPISAASGINTSIPLASADRPINIVTLVLSLLTIGIVLSVLVLTQVRVLPRTTLVNSMCWATICGLGSYIIYGYGWIPGAYWLADTLHVLGAPIIVFISMLIPLLWLQLRELVHVRPPQTE